MIRLRVEYPSVVEVEKVVIVRLHKSEVEPAAAVALVEAVQHSNVCHPSWLDLVGCKYELLGGHVAWRWTMAVHRLAPLRLEVSLS
jgi:hypothetical protein